MNKKILVVCGPTATGKTKLGIYLAKKFNGEIISADSRQVFKHMNIGTGKEWGKAKIWGYDLINPWEEYSVAKYVNFAKDKLSDIWERGKLPIVVGGTGLYIKAITDGIDTINIPRNKNLRNGLIEKSVAELFEELATLDSIKAASMNLSDKKNPRRLVRAIEVAIWKIQNEPKRKKQKIKKEKLKLLFIGLNYSQEELSNRILQRVEERIENGFIDEVENLLKMGVSWKMQSMNALGYKDTEGFLKQGLSYEEFLTKWYENEVKYAKRQLTWFKKDKRINWFDIKEKNYIDKVEKMVKKWV